MEIHEMKQLIDLWDALYDKRYSVDQVIPAVSNLDRYFKDEILGAKIFKEAHDIVLSIREADLNFKKECEQRLIEDEIKLVKTKMKEALQETIWSMLSDAPLSNEGRNFYRNYRQYIRDIPDLWRRRQIKKLSVMSFTEWKDNPPVYKVERKVIL